MYEGYLSLSGIELMNAERTAAYVKHASAGIPFKPSRKMSAPNLHVALEEDAYESPLIDDAEWVDPADPDTHNFYGMYPLSVEGIGDSTREASSTESISDGGTVGRARDGSRVIRVRGLLIGGDELAVEAGLSWLRAAVKTDECGAHGEMCGYNDLRYFLAPPEVCVPKWGPGVGTEITDSLGSVSPEYSPLIYDVPLYRGYDNLSPADVRWNLPMVDGGIVRWGKMDLSDDVVDWQSPATALLRTNYIRNPRFAVDTSNWTIGGTAAMYQHDTGGPGSGTYGEFADTDAALTRTNWFPDPAFTLDASESQWRTNGASVQHLASDYMATVPSRIARFAGDSSTMYPLYAEVSALGPVTATTSTVSMYLLQSENVLVEVFDNWGVETYSQSFSLPSPIQRISFVTEMAQNYVVRVTAGGTEIRVAGIMVEEGAVLRQFFFGGGDSGGLTTYGYGLGGYGEGPYGVGETVAASSTDPRYFYLDGTPSSPSRFQDNDLSLITATANLGDAPFGQVIAGMDMRSNVGAEVTIQLLSTDDGSVLGSRTEVLDGTWRRLYVSAEHGRESRLFISSMGSFDLTNVVQEAGAIPLPYFDGDTELDDYDIQWVAIPNQSYSRATWTGTTRLTSNESNWRPFLSVLQGTLHNVSITYVDPDQIPLQEQLDPYERTYHRVSVIEGPSIIRWHRVSVGAALEVDLILLATSPHAYSNDRVVPFELGSSISYLEPVTDSMVNWVYNPSAEGTELSLEPIASPVTVARSSGTNGTSWPPEGLWSYVIDLNTLSTAGGRLKLTQRPSAAVGQRWHFRTRITMATGSAPIFLMRMTAIFYSNPPGSGTNTVVQETQKQEISLNINTKPSSEFSFYATAPAGTQSVGFKIERISGVEPTNVNDAFYIDRISMIEDPSSVPPLYFTGSTPRTAQYEYTWMGAVNNSPSERAETDVPLLSDPSCPAPPPAPRAPAIPEDCVDVIPLWNRYSIPVPASNIALWAGTVPTLTFTTGATEKRQIRMRFYQNPFDYEKTLVDPDSYCGEFVVGYIPPNTVMQINGVTERVFAQIHGGQTVPADHLVYGTKGAPPEWPTLSCAIPYVVTIDVDPTQTLNDMQIELVVNRQE